ncbi:site-specific integrase [Candidatus Gracilibacteria bacterium]|nr:MAG: site-specific integrase [Candidatus Gracilibacteria bacterium]
MERITKNKKYKEYLEKWIRYHSQFIKKSTYASYLLIIQNHIIKDLGDYQIKDITNQILQEFTLKKLQNGKIKKDGGLSIEVVKDILAVIKLSLKFAIKKGLIRAFDMTIDYPRAIQDKNLKIFSKKEQQLLSKYLLENINHKNIGLLICLYCGIRIGELCALQYKDINFSEKYLKIEKTLQRIYIKGEKTKIIITKPKTSSSIRKIPLSNFLLKELKKFKLENDIFVLTGTKKYTEPRTYREHYKKMLKNLNIKFRNFHSLRHTFASRCIELNIDYKTVSELLGHSSVNTTLNLYVHSNFSQKEKAINKLFDTYTK